MAAVVPGSRPARIPAPIDLGVGAKVRPEEASEVTLGFALGVDADGEPHEFSEPVVLATILASVEADRGGLGARLGLAARDSVEAVASVYWPIAVLPAPVPGRVAVFDGTGVWRRTFRHSLLPSLEPIHGALDVPRSPADLLGTLEGLRPRFLEDPGAEVLHVEGFLPVDPPLLFDVLSQTSFPREPQTAHPGFLPARHDYAWYAAAVAQIARWVGRFDADLQQLDALRAKVADRLGAALVVADAETEQVRREGAVHLARARAELTREAERLHSGVHAQLRRESEVVRLGQAEVAKGTIDQRTAGTLAGRSIDRGTDAGPHHARGRRSKTAVRDAQRSIRESIERLEALHERERSALVALTGRATTVESAEAERLAARELFRDELGSVAHDVMDALDGHAAARRQQRDALQQYFVSPAGMPPARIVWFPLWMALLRGPQGVRTLVFPPMRLRTRRDLGAAFKGLFGGVDVPFEARTPLFEGALRRTFEDAVATDPWLAHATAEIVRGADVLSDPDLARRLQAGLRELEAAGWLSAKASRRLSERYEELGRVRDGEGVLPPETSAGSGLAGHGPPPIAA
ncbi:MAG TPA: hypothetical protein VJQ43_00735 [Thermoplasmata archaeon]|nr:hypothetical protein [Thermoplasmata archaeon]